MSDRPEASWLAVGRVRRPHGVHGEVTVEVVTDFPQRLVSGVEVGLGQDGPDARATVHQVRWHKGDWLLSFEGIGSRDVVDEWRGWWLFLPAQERSSLPEHYYYEHELVGCRALRGPAVLGDVTGLVGGPGGALLAVATAGGEVLVPFTSPIVIRVDLAARTVELDPPRGLFDDDAL